MLTQYNIDKLMQSIQNGEEVFLYYIAHNIELREGIIDEHQYKSVNKFKPIKIKLTNIVNAYIEYRKFKQNPENYHTEVEEEYYDEFTKFYHYYTVENESDSFIKGFNSRIPSIIYGYRRRIFEFDKEPRDINDPSPVIPIYTNNISYGDLFDDTLHQAQNNGLLDWKYIRVDEPIINDGIEYYNITSDYYILDIENFPRVEKPLINVKHNNAYFLELSDAFNYLRQLEA